MKYDIEFVLKAKNEAENAFRRTKEQIDEVSKSVTNFSSVAQTALGVLSAYAGTKGLGMIVGAYEEANRTLVQSQFYLRGMTGSVEGNLGVLRRWGAEMQREIGVNDEFAMLVASRLGPRINDLNKMMDYARTLLIGHRIGVLDAESASIMLMRAAEGNTRAMTWLAYQLGITVYEFESMDSIMEKIRRRLEGLQDQLSPFDKSWAVLKETWGDLMESVGRPLVEVLGKVLGWILEIITQFPTLGKVAAGAFALMTAGLALLGAKLALTPFIPFFAGLTAMAGPWGIALGLAIGGVIISLGMLKDAMARGGYEMSLQGLGQFIKDTFIGIGIYIKEWLATLPSWFSNAWEMVRNRTTTILPYIIEEIVRWFSQLPQRIWNAIVGISHFFIRLWEDVRNICMNLIPNLINTMVDYFRQLPSRIWDAIKNIPSQVGNMFKDIGSQISSGFSAGYQWIKGGFQFGGYVPETGLYMLHRGEMVAPAGRGASTPITITITGNTFLSEDSAVRMGDLIVRALQRQLRI